MSGVRMRSALAVAATAGLIAAGGVTATVADAAPTGQRVGSAAATFPVHQSSCTAAYVAHGVVCYTPQVLRTAYGINPLLARGVAGRGETVVLIEETVPKKVLKPHSEIYVRQSVFAYDKRFGLPPVNLRVDNALAPLGATNRVSSPEEVLDIDMVHAMAPAAKIDVELISAVDPADPSNHEAFFDALPTGIRRAAKLGQVLSLSYGTAEACAKSVAPRINAALARAESRGLSVFASSGDQADTDHSCTNPLGYGASPSVALPASDPLVTSVGGTALAVNPVTGAYAGETVWNQQEQADAGKGPPAGSGGGFSALFPRPAYQAGVLGIGAQRGVPDVAFDAYNHDGPAIVEYAEGSQCTPTQPGASVVMSAGAAPHCIITTPEGGTSVGAPAWAGIAALADQEAGHPLGFLNPTIYKIAESPAYAQAFHDVTTGNNSSVLNGTSIPGFSAAPGWDPVTGWGSPNAQVLVPLLAHGG